MQRFLKKKQQHHKYVVNEVKINKNATTMHQKVHADKMNMFIPFRFFLSDNIQSYVTDTALEFIRPNNTL